MQILLKEALLQQNGVESNQKIQKKKKKNFSVMHFFPDSKNIKSHLFEDLT